MMPIGRQRRPCLLAARSASRFDAQRDHRNLRRLEHFYPENGN
jgi:hypothetical protein